ncbi:hypothetical protein [Pseudomonas sp. Leaf58]|uniref:hypothetical protein n=1 Tax=Pseudomonas sp. Leaf58 TaxID=1736226 RepID=UPI0012E94613|nr:hypothetical protein [Pseudomonas sp. Leaf58]
MPKHNTTTVTFDTTTESLSNNLLDQIMAEAKLTPTQEGYTDGHHLASTGIPAA